MHNHRVEPTTVNFSPSKFRVFVRINQVAKLKVHFIIGSQWSVPREIVRIKYIAIVDCNLWKLAITSDPDGLVGYHLVHHL